MTAHIEPRQGVGNSLDELSPLITKTAIIANRRYLQSCLWIGHSDTFAEALTSEISESGNGCAFYVGAASSGPDRQLIDKAYVMDGVPVGAPEFPKPDDILGFARTQPDPAAVTTSASAALAACHSGTGRTSLEAIEQDFGLTAFDLVVIAGDEVVTDAIVQRVRGSRAILFDGARTTLGGAAAFARLFADTEYLLAAYNDHEQGGWALFVQRDQSNSNLPIHFFTIILNGEPFIRYHEQMLLELDFPWHWHVIEGVASLVKDTAWSVAAGGHIPDSLHDRGKSNDGTTQYLDELKARYPNRVSIYRKPADTFWDGKLEMVSAPIPEIKEPCLLWQIDGDELWTPDQVQAVRRAFMEDPDRSAAYFWCNYFVGPDKGISTRLNYAQNPNQEWLRVWRFEPGMIWDKHEPPVLAGVDADGNAYDVGQRNPFRHREMEAIGAVFDHFAYSTAEQAQFKESYYGYKGAVDQWRALQTYDRGSGHLRDYFAWVSDDTMFDTADRLGWAPVAYFDHNASRWLFRTAGQQAELKAERRAQRRPKIVVDGIFFQLGSSGIARVWINLLKEWVRTGYADNVVLLDRAKTAPRIDGVIYRTIEAHTWESVDGDARYLQEICDMEEADLFVSTYYTTPIRTPSIFFGHDMIPEIMGFDLDDLWWRQKRRAIQYAAGHIMVSQSSANDMCAFHPEVDRDRVLVAYNSVSEVFRPCGQDEIEAFRSKHGIDRPFVMTVGERFGWKGYKNGSVVFAALTQIPEEQRPLLVCVGGQPQLEDVGKAVLNEEDVRILQLDDDDLRACYAAAMAYICPSSLEGFGLPIAEAMSVGCPALVCRNSSIPEVAGEAGIYFDPNDPAALVAAIHSASDSNVRAKIIEQGKLQAARFSQARTAAQISEYLEAAVTDLKSGNIRVKSQALEDALKDAEARRRAEYDAERLSEALSAMKRKVSASSRISPLSHPTPTEDLQSVASLVASQDNSLMIALERRLAAAYAQLRSQENAERYAEPVSIAQAPSFAEASVAMAGGGSHGTQAFGPMPPVSTRGLNDIEGPYRDAGVKHRFRWQVERVSKFSFDVPESAQAIFEFDFCNVEPGQTLTVRRGGEVIGSVSPPEAGWENEWHVALPIKVDEGPVEIAIEAQQHAVFEGDNTPRYIALLGVSLRADPFIVS